MVGLKLSEVVYRRTLVLWTLEIVRKIKVIEIMSKLLHEKTGKDL